ncbi:MAG TPA: DUF503 domain-containing protein [Chloroflexota bacterium]|nr:DUF503 domain-containing protein [Chloroflexota bacterium]
MIVGILRVTVEIPEAASLKDKRAVVSSLKGRVEARFRVSIAEVHQLENHHQAELGVAVVANDRRRADEVMNRIADFALQHSGDGYVSDIRTEIINLG